MRLEAPAVQGGCIEAEAGDFICFGDAFWHGGTKYDLQTSPWGKFAQATLTDKRYVHFRWHAYLLDGAQGLPHYDEDDDGYGGGSEAEDEQEDEDEAEEEEAPALKGNGKSGNSNRRRSGRKARPAAASKKQKQRAKQNEQENTQQNQKAQKDNGNSTLFFDLAPSALQSAPQQQVRELQSPFDAAIDKWLALGGGEVDPRAHQRGARNRTTLRSLPCSLNMKMHWVVQVACSTKRAHLQSTKPHRCVQVGALCTLTCSHSTNAAVTVVITGIGQAASYSEAVRQWGAAALTPFVPGTKGAVPRQKYGGATTCVPAGSSGVSPDDDCRAVYAELYGSGSGSGSGSGAGTGSEESEGGSKGGPYYVLFAYRGSACYRDEAGLVPARDADLHPNG
jgi:hypothetical protein